MSKTEVSGKQIKDGSVELVDLSAELSGDINTLKSDVATLQTDVASKADAGNLASVATSGSYNDLSDKPTIPSVEGLATETYVDTAVAGLVNSAPETLNTLKELSDALGADANFATTVAGQIGDVAADVTTLEGRVDDLENNAAGVPSLAELSGVSITSPSADQILKYDGFGWVNGAAPSSFSGSYTDLTDKPSLFDGAYSSLTGAPSLATVATSGSYADLSNKPTLATVATSGSYTDLTNKPTVPSTLDDLSDVVITSASKGQFVVHNGTSFINSNTIEASGAAIKPLIVKGAASQTANLLEAQNSSATAMFSVDSSGNISIASTTVSSNISIIGDVNSHASLSLRALGTPAANEFYIGQGNNNIGYVWQRAANKIALGTNNAERMTIAGDGTTGVNESSPGGQLQVTSGAAARKAMIVKAAASQTANLLEAQNSSATSIFSVGSAGAVYAAGAITTDGAITPSNSAFGPKLWNGGQGYSIGLGYGSTVSGGYAIAIGTNAAAGNNGLKISWGYGGVSAVGGNITGLSSGNCGINETSPGGSLHVTAYAATAKGLIVKAAASQTANLFEAQNSGGTALVSISSAGAISTASTLSTTGGITCGGTFTIGTNAITSSTDINLTPGSNAADRIIFNNLQTTASAANAYFGSSGGIVKSTSSIRYKTDIEPLDLANAEAIFDALNPIRYRSLASEDRQDKKFYGLIAEEVAQVEPMLVAWAHVPSVSDELVPDGVSYDRLAVLLIPIIKKQKEQIAALEARLAALENK